MVVMPGLSQPLEAAGKCITSWDDSGSRLVVKAGSVVRWATCPRCTCGSARPHGRYRRSIADSPSFGLPVTLTVEIREQPAIEVIARDRAGAYADAARTAAPDAR